MVIFIGVFLSVLGICLLLTAWVMLIVRRDKQTEVGARRYRNLCFLGSSLIATGTAMLMGIAS